MKPDIDAKFYCPRNIDKFENNNFANNWFFSASTFVFYCGLHADYTTLMACLNRAKKENMFLKNFYFLTFLREPIERFVSEWFHIVYNGDEWSKFSKNYCNQETIMKKCFPTRKSDSISLNEFIECENNMASNRQTRMLANYFLNGQFECSLFDKKNKKKLLDNAKLALLKLAYFGLTEFEVQSEYLLEKMINNELKFTERLNLRVHKSEGSTILNTLNQTTIDRIKMLNDLDLELYEFARQIFFQRIEFHQKRVV